MIQAIASPIGFIILVSFFLCGAIGSLFFRKKDVLANGWSSFFAISGSLWAMTFAILSFFADSSIIFSTTSAAFPLLAFSFNIDKLASFFIFIISLIALFCSIYGIGYVKDFYKKYDIGVLGFFYHLFIAGMILVVSSANSLFFLIAWEIMAIASYFLVIYDRKDLRNVKAGLLYLIMTHVGTVFIIIAFLLFYKFTDSFDFEAIKSRAELIPLSAKNIIFVLAIIGFGTKAGIIPFHIWLPSAHPAAPSHVSALMSGVMIKTALYMMIRLFFDMLQPVPLWWGIVVLVVGSVSALFGVLYALAESDLKRLLAYSSIENIGIILIGLGSSLIFLSSGEQSFALFALTAALFHILNHAIFKSLLFLSAGSVIHQTHTRNMEEYGGLIRYMPQTSFFFLVGAMAVSALPPLNGFFSEWLIFQLLFQGMQFGLIEKMIFLLGAGTLAITGGLALACFVKAFGATFLARPRSSEITQVPQTKESSFSLRAGMGALAALCLLFGIFSNYLIFVFEKIGHTFSVLYGTRSLVSLSSDRIFIAGNSFASISPFAIFVFLIVVILLLLFFMRFVVYKKQKVHIGATWDCGSNLSPRMEINSTGFARSIVLIFCGVLKQSIQREVRYHDSAIRYLPKSITVDLCIHDIYQSYFYKPLCKMISTVSLYMKKIQGGNVNAYILYIFVAFIILFFVI